MYVWRCLTGWFTSPRCGCFVLGSDPWQGPVCPTRIQPGHVDRRGVGRYPAPGGGLGSALPWARCSARATATPGCRGCRRAGAVKQSGLQVLISLPRGLCKNEHGNTQAGQLAVKHQAGRVLCRIFKVSWREMVLKDYCGTVSRHIPYSMDFYHSVKRNNSHLPSQMLPAEFLFLKYLRKVLEASNLSLGS